ncbi:hypothetical protein ACF068_16170 [Streptomyces sp. NPDC016309]|uniref:hypothetical protein n=1 Tax=Streptomyces sp. NPDC016309 TaxID=3364965 RepID=UPI003701ACBF
MRTRIRRGVAVALTVSALTLTAACGGSSDKGDGAAKGKDAAKPADKPAAAALTAEQMKAGLLELKDLPAGWKAEAAAPSEDMPAADKPECKPINAIMGDKIEGTTLGDNAEFGDKDSSILAELLATFSDDKAATDFMKTVATAADTCTGFSFTAEGQKVPVKVEKLTAPTAGEESTAVRLSMEMAPGMTIVSDLLVARQGAGLMRLAYVPTNQANHKNFDDLAKRAGDKFVKAAQS